MELVAQAPPALSVTVSGVKPDPTTSTPSPLRVSIALVTYSLVNASGSGCLVRTVAPSAFFACNATWTVRSQAAWSIVPTPAAGDGQISLLISLTCHSWWLAPSFEPAFTTMSRHDSGLSRQYAQPSSEPAMNFVVVSW